MGDQIGLPIWQEVGNMKKNDLTKNTLSQKILQTNEEDGTVLYAVPIIEDDYLTSILFTEMKGEEVTEVKNITNDDLWYVINNEEISQEYRESLLLTFLSIDNEVFQTPIYTNIPVGLAGITEDIPNRIRILPKTKTSENGKYMVEYSCVHIIINCTCSSYYNCDRCNNSGQCVTISNCGLTFIDDGIELPSNNGGGSSSGGGGGTGTGTAEGPKDPNQPKDPCANANVFYRLMPSCGGGGLGEVDPVLDDHCEKTKAIFTSTAVKSRYEILKGKTSEPKESGYGFKSVSDGQGGMTTETTSLNPDTSPDKMKVNIFPTSYGYIHTHLDKTNGDMAVKIFSPADINTFITFLHNAQTNGTPLGNIFGGMIASDPDTGHNIYQITYSGNGIDLPSEFTDAQVETLKKWYANEAQQILNNNDGILTHSDMQRLFYVLLKKMNLKNVVLSKIEYNTTKYKTIKFDANGNPTEETCP